MRINKQSKRSKRILFIALAVLLLVCFVAAVVWARSSSNNTSSETPAVSGQKSDKKTVSQEAESSQKSPTPESTEPTTEKEKERPPQYEGPSSTISETLTGSINYSAVAGNTLIIRTTINQMVSSGFCEITLSNGSKRVTKSSGLVQNPSSSTCQGFDIPTSELGAGNWNISIKVSGDGKTGTLNGGVEL